MASLGRDKQDLQNTARRVSELEEWVQFSRMLSAAPDFQTMLAVAVEQAMKFVEAEAGTFWFLDEEQDILLPLVTRGPRAEAMKDLHLQRGEGIVGQVLESGKPVLIADVTADSRWARRFDLTTGFITRSLLVLPFMAKGKVIGVLQLVNKQNKHAFDNDDLQKGQALIEQSAPVIYKSRLFSTQEKFLLGLLKILASLAESQNKGHAERVCRYAGLIAEKLEMNREERRALTYASLLHDLGKIAVDDQEKHPSAGAQMLYQLEPTSLTRQIWRSVLYHHEKYDGSGFPAGLKGKDIPLLARIISVADFFDHLTGKAERKSLAEAAGELKHYSGNYLDPQLVEVFITALKDNQGKAFFGHPAAGGSRPLSP